LISLTVRPHPALVQGCIHFYIAAAVKAAMGRCLSAGVQAFCFHGLCLRHGCDAEHHDKNAAALQRSYCSCYPLVSVQILLFRNLYIRSAISSCSDPRMESACYRMPVSGRCTTVTSPLGGLPHPSITRHLQTYAIGLARFVDVAPEYIRNR